MITKFFKVGNNIFGRFQLNIKKFNVLIPEEYNHIYSDINEKITITQNDINLNEIKTFFKYMINIRENVEKLPRVEDISRKYLSLLNKIFDKELIDENNASELIPYLISTTCLLKTNDDEIWGIIEVLYTKYIHKISLEKNMAIMNDMLNLFIADYNDSLKLEKFKKLLFDNLTKYKHSDVLELNYMNLIILLTIFSNYFTKRHQVLLDDIFITMIKVYREKMIHGNLEFITTCMFKLSDNKNINISYLCENLIDDIIQNLPVIKLKHQLFILLIYKRLISSKHTSKFYKIKKIFNYCEFEIISNIDSLLIDEVINILEMYVSVGLGSPELFLALDKKIGLNIDKVNPKSYVLILDSFIRSKNYRDKFIYLIQKKILENLEEMSLIDLSRILRIFAILKTENIIIFEKCYDYIKSNIEKFDDYGIADLIFAYSNNKIKNNLLLTDLEYIIDSKLINFKERQMFDIIIDICISYLIADKGSKEFHDKMKNIIIDIDIDKTSLDYMSVLKMYQIFQILKVEYDKVCKFDILLRNNLQHYKNNELVNLKLNLLKINGSDSEIYKLISTLLTIQNEKEKILYLNKNSLI